MRDPAYVWWRDLLLGGLPAALSALALALRGCRDRARNAPGARAWMLSALAVSAFEVGNIVWYVWVQHQDAPPYPSVADPFWLAYYLIALLVIVMGAVRARLTL